MSKISISVANPTNDLKAVKLVHEVTAITLGSIRSRLKEGKKGIFYTTELFLNDHKKRESEIRKLILGFESLKLELFIMEIAYDESWADVDDFDQHRISSQELLNTLDRCTDDFH